MRVLGLSGLFSTEKTEYLPDAHPAFFHDAAACIVEDGVVLAAVEEERVSRDKHTNRFPLGAARECLDIAGLGLRDVDGFAYFFDEAFTDREFALEALHRPELPIESCRELVANRLSEDFGGTVETEKVVGIRHHDTHAATAYFHSGYESALVVVMDGNGEDESLSIFEGRGGALRLLHRAPRAASLGHYYTVLTRLIGYGDFDEYKVMGLAPYGNPDRYSELFDQLIELSEEGEYRLDVATMAGTVLDGGIRPRRSGQEMEAEHRDLAAAGQRALERVVLHVVGHWAKVTGFRRLCLAGGVAQNTSMNGRLANAGLFDAVYVHPAAHDGGAAIGAALLLGQRGGDEPAVLPHAYLGRDIGTEQDIASVLERWSAHVEWTRPENLAAATADVLAAGGVVGWAQGRAEFGPRALGNRSILADPRPAENRDRVNRLIKQREGYRPFAPVVAEADAGRFFEMPDCAADFSYMGFVMPVRPERRADLGAVTHVDGSARVQVLRPDANPPLAGLIEEFGRRTGVPVLLNTSFNNYAEPIVHTPEDAVICLLTTGLSALVVGPYVVTRRNEGEIPISTLRVGLMPHCEVVTTASAVGERRTVVRRRTNKRHSLTVEEQVGRLVADGGVLDTSGVPSSLRDTAVADLRRLWDRRLIRVSPETRCSSR